MRRTSPKPTSWWRGKFRASGRKRSRRCGNFDAQPSRIKTLAFLFGCRAALAVRNKKKAPASGGAEAGGGKAGAARMLDEGCGIPDFVLFLRSAGLPVGRFMSSSFLCGQAGTPPFRFAYSACASSSLALSALRMTKKPQTAAPTTSTQSSTMNTICQMGRL